MSKTHNFYNELSNLRRRLEKGDKILYNKEDDDNVQLDEPEWDELYEIVSNYSSVYQYDMGLGVHAHNLATKYNMKVFGSVPDLSWLVGPSKIFKLSDDVHVLRGFDTYPETEIVLLVDVLGGLPESRQKELLDQVWTFSEKGVVVYDSRVRKAIMKESGFENVQGNIWQKRKNSPNLLDPSFSYVSKETTQSNLDALKELNETEEENEEFGDSV